MSTVVKLDSQPQTGFADEKVDGLIEEIKALRPMLQENAAKGEELRTLTPEVDAALRKLGILNLLTPTRWGGGGLSCTAFAKVQMELAKGDPSVSWVSQIINGTTMIATLASDHIQEVVFGNGPNTVCSAYNPPGKARKVDGGYIVNGAWPYSSGSRQAEWIQGGCLIEESDAPVTPGMNFAYIRMSDLEIKDSWYVTGMQGTGSDTTVAKDIFVPDDMMVTMDKPYGHVEPGKKHIGAPTDSMAVVPTVRATGLAQLLGAAEYMLELVERDAPNKPVVTTTFARKTDSHVVLHDLGKVGAQLDTARVLLFTVTGQVDDAALAGTTFTPLEAAAHKAKCAMIVELIHTSIEKLMFIAGSSAFMLSNPLQRYWRDVHVGLRHVTNLPHLSYEIYGRDRLQVEPNITPAGAY
jgi:alkylation response protein AidB-like acyl-CoA dehydrogenase